MVFLFALSKTQWFSAYKDGKINIINVAAIIAVFGLLSIIASHYFSSTYNGAIISIRDLPAMVAGLLGGPITGLGAGLIGGVERYAEGGITALPCMIGTILSGLIGGAFWCLAAKKFPKIIFATVAMLIAEVIHTVLVYFLADGDTIADNAEIVANISPWMIGFTVLGAIIIAVIYDKYIRPSSE